MEKFAKQAVSALMGALAAGVLLPATGAAQTPSYAQPGSAPPPPPAEAAQPPSYARPGYASDEETIHGRIVSFSGAYKLEIRDDRGFIDHVGLRQGTVINPAGLRLAQGMSVTVLGYNRGSTFQANEIDTPYTSEYPVPAYGYGYYGPYIIAPSFGWGYYHRWR